MDDVLGQEHQPRKLARVDPGDKMAEQLILAAAQTVGACEHS